MEPSHQFQPHNCGTCGNKHPPRKCWIKNQVMCSNCGGYHPTDRCKKPNKVIPLNPPPRDYHKQARDNMRGVRFPKPLATSGPPNLFYDHQNHRQTHNPLAMLQTKQGKNNFGVCRVEKWRALCFLGAYQRSSCFHELISIIFSFFLGACRR